MSISKSEHTPLRAGKSTKRRRARNLLPPIVLGILLLSLWAWVTRPSGISHIILPSPSSVGERLIHGWTSIYPSATWATLCEACMSCLIAGILGVPCGYLLARFKLFSRAAGPYIAAAQALPGVALAPLLVIWIGYGFPSIIVLCIIMVLFPVMVTSALGFSSIDADVLGAARLDGARGLRLFISIELPLASPAILSGMRVGFTLSVTGAVVGEMVMGGSGLGMLLTSAQASSDIAGLFAVVAILAVFASGIYALLGGCVNWCRNYVALH